ncbi:MAG: hypothetical protein HS108_05670 [Planctomycetes bacterium]|nr:hypothetical protein [Planctomycetota bacterium]MCL4730691.1 hypothetical protein [Planctomycetota bacterium]
MRTLACLITLCLLSPLCADIGPKPRKTAPGPLPQGDLEGINVEMTSEDVRLTLGKGSGDMDVLDVVATFNMTNLGDAASFEIGFPCGPFANMKRFSVETDGKSHDFELVDRAAGAKEQPQDRNGRTSRHDYWYVWQASYAAKAKVTHIVRYQLEIFHFSQYRDTGYVLNTGAGWKNKIGKATVTLSFTDSLTADHVREVSPGKGLTFKDGVYTWVFTDLEPTAADNISISYNNRETIPELLKRFKDDSSWSGKTELVALTRRAHKRFGRDRMTETELADYLSALNSLLDGMKEEDGKVTMPAGNGRGGTAPYAMKNEAHSLLNYYHEVVATARDNTAHPAVKPLLVRWNTLIGAYLEGTLYAGSEKMTIGNYKGLADKIGADLKERLAEGRKLAE